MLKNVLMLALNETFMPELGTSHHMKIVNRVS